jgi:hypothetical protein
VAAALVRVENGEPLNPALGQTGVHGVDEDLLGQ